MICKIVSCGKEAIWPYKDGFCKYHQRCYDSDKKRLLELSRRHENDEVKDY